MTSARHSLPSSLCTVLKKHHVLFPYARLRIWFQVQLFLSHFGISLVIRRSSAHILNLLVIKPHCFALNPTTCHVTEFMNFLRLQTNTRVQYAATQTCTLAERRWFCLFFSTVAFSFSSCISFLILKVTGKSKVKAYASLHDDLYHHVT